MPLTAVLLVALAASRPVGASEAGDRARAGGAPPRVVTVTARDHAFEAPDTIASGAVTFRLRDLGPTSHHLIVFRLADSISLAKFYERTSPGVVSPPGVESLGGPEAGEEVTIVLRPGRYALGCLKDFDDGATHLSRGMFRALTVVAGEDSPVPPRHDVTVTMRDYQFALSGPLRAGRRTVRLVNAGAQEHHVLVRRLEPGRTVADVERWLAGGRKGTSPLSPVSFGTSRQSRGETLYVAVDFPAGNYVFICRVPDASDGRPHVEHGMRTGFRVEEAPRARAGRSPPSAPAPLPGHVVDVAAGEFFFQSPDSIAAGLTTFRLSQVGLIRRRALAGGAARDSAALDRGDQTRGFHMLWVVRLHDGKTASDYHRALAAGEPTPWARVLGGPGFSMPPATSNASLVLEPGHYVLACLVGGARADRSRYHLLHGMFRPLTVLPAASPPAEVPVPDVVVRISESGAIHFSAPILPGRRLLRVENAGARAYEFSVRRVLPGHRTEDALAWRRAASATMRAPFDLWGGLSDVPAGGSLLTTIAFEPGDYFVGAAERVPFTVAPRGAERRRR